MKLLFARLFALTFLVTTLSLLNGEEEKEPTLFVDSINPKVLTDLAIPGKDYPETIIQQGFYRVPFSDDGTAVSNDSEANMVYHSLIEDIPEGNFTFGAISQIQRQISASLTESGHYGIAVVVDPDQIDAQTGDDYREEGDTSLNLNVWIGEVTSQRTVAKGKRIREGSLINHPLHDKIIKNAPFTKASEASLTGEFIIDKPKLDNYLERLNRSVNRRVDVAVSSAGEPGKLVLDYIVNEPKSWLGYLQLSNTGTDSTGEWRERIGGVHYQLTGNDDILAVDYFTAEFDTANAALITYDFPLVNPDYLIFRSYASYSDFAAENLSFASNPDAIGTTTTYGAELKYTPFYFSDHAVTFDVGFNYENVKAENATGVGLTGFGRFLSPYIRVRASKTKREHRSIFSAQFEKNFKNNEQNEFSNLGRTNITDDYGIYRFNLYQSFFLEPLLPGYKKSNPDEWLASTLVHEFAFSLRGQYLTNNTSRLIPQKQMYAGGFFSVRGYNESAARGDEGFIGSAEYRIHLARLLKPYSLLEEPDRRNQINKNEMQNRFNFRAPSLYGFPDWNLMARGFVDFAKLSVNEQRFNEFEQDLLSFGVGLEFQYLANLNIRLDYGVVQDELEASGGSIEEDGDQGDSRFHLIVTYSF